MACRDPTLDPLPKLTTITLTVTITQIIQYEIETQVHRLFHLRLHPC